jgi:uncharacterized membrane protein YraQ (UPF0718 family)
MIAAIQLVLGILTSITFLVLRSSPTLAEGVSPTMGALTTWQIILFYPLSNLIGGFIMGLIIGYLYNILAPKIGGVLFELEEVSDKKVEVSKENKK